MEERGRIRSAAALSVYREGQRARESFHVLLFHSFRQEVSVSIRRTAKRVFPSSAMINSSMYKDSSLVALRNQWLLFQDRICTENVVEVQVPSAVGLC